MNIAKYILSIFLIMASFSGMAKGDFITGLFTLILGIILLPPISEKIKKQIILFQNKKIRYGIYLVLMAIAGAFIPKSEAEVFGSKEDVFINYIKSDKNDKSLQNIKSLAEIGGIFGNSNYSTVYPQQGYISEQYDSIKKVAVLTFNPKLFSKNKDIKYLNTNSKNGILKDYLMTFVINSKDSIISKTTTMIFSKSGTKIFSNKNVPNVESLFNTKIIEKQRVIAQKKEAIRQEKIKFNEIMGDDSFWNTYDPLVKRRIYNLIIKKDCRGLQEEFTVSADRMDVKQAQGRSASRELELMDFIDDKKRELGCYGK